MAKVSKIFQNFKYMSGLAKLVNAPETEQNSVLVKER